VSLPEFNPKAAFASTMRFSLGFVNKREIIFS